MIKNCPGKDLQDIKPEDIVEKKCLWCKTEVEIWPDEQRIKCPKCKKWVYKDEEIVPSCIEWCKSAEECFGKKRFEKFKKRRQKP